MLQLRLNLVMSASALLQHQPTGTGGAENHEMFFLPGTYRNVLPSRNLLPSKLSPWESFELHCTYVGLCLMGSDGGHPNVTIEGCKIYKSFFQANYSVLAHLTHVGRNVTVNWDL